MKITTNKILQYREYLINEEKSKVTVEKYIRDIQTFSQWLDNRDLTKPAVLEYKNELIKNYAPSSVNSVIAALNGFFTYNEWYGLKVKSLKLQKALFVPVKE